MTDQQPTPVIATITGADLLGKLDSLSSSFNELSRKLDDVPARVHENETRIREMVGVPGTVQDHESRLRALERRLWVIGGAAAVGGYFISWVLQQMGR